MPLWQFLTERDRGAAAMSGNPRPSRLERQESQAHNGKLLEISYLPKYQPVVSQLYKEQKFPTLTSDHNYLDNKVLGKRFLSLPFESNWKNAVIKTKKIKQEYTSAYGLREISEYTAMPSLIQESERYQVISNPSPIVQKTEGTASSFPVSSCINEDYTCLPPLYLLPSDSSQYFDGFYKNRGDIALDDSHRGELCSQDSGSLKALGGHGGTGEVDVVRLKNYNQCSSLIPFPNGSEFKPGYCFTDPVSGAPPQYLRRLSELAALECKTIQQENRKLRKTKKSDSI